MLALIFGHFIPEINYYDKNRDVLRSLNCCDSGIFHHIIMQHNIAVRI